MNITVFPSQLNGAVTAPPSKSDVHRAVICAALSGDVCRITPVAFSNDIRATVGCVESLGARCDYSGGALTVDGTKMFKIKSAELDCGESGSTLRFLIPIAAAGGVKTTFTGKGRLPERPIGIYLDCLPKAGVECITEGGLPLTIDGRLQSGEFKVAGDVSSQFITGLLLALPLLDGDSKITLTSPLKSTGYVDMTINCMERFGVKVERLSDGFSVGGNQRYIPQDYTCEGDWSQAAFFMAAGALSGDVTVRGLARKTAQGDMEIAELLTRMGAKLEYTADGVRVRKSELKAVDVDAGDIPDLVPILSVLLSFAEGESRVYNAERLRIKESDRLKTTAAMLNSLGGKVTELPDGLVIQGVKSLQGGTVDGANDHRIVMAACVAALRCKDEVVITDSESINKSYPDYFEEYKRLGGLC